MRTSKCTSCNNTVFFENVRCMKCKSALAFDPVSVSIVALKPGRKIDGAHTYNIVDRPSRDPVRYCTNYTHGVCNWVTSAKDSSGFCRACDLNRTIPNLDTNENLQAWNTFERAKKRLIFTFLRFGLPFDTLSGASTPLMFDFKEDAVTGHLNGLITVDVDEADDIERERQRRQFDEPFRTLLGHLRHESGHYFWSFLAASPSDLEEFRSVFGDERQDYTDSLDRHYERGAKVDWEKEYVSAYAASHPWEDWAETWAHYLHMVDALETAESIGMEPRAVGLNFGMPWPFRASDIYRDVSFSSIMERWIGLSIAMNSLNRSIGHNDFYPVVLPPATYTKFEFVQKFIRDLASR